MAVAGKQAGSFDEKSFNERVEQPEDFCGVLEGLEHRSQSKITHHEHLGKIADGQAASPVVKHNIGTFSRMGAGSNPSSPMTEASILGPSPFRSAVAPDHSSGWSASVSPTAGVRSALQLTPGATSVAPSTHGQLEAAYDAVILPSRAAQVPGHSPGWPASVSTTAGAPMALQPIAVAPAVPEPACGRLEITHLTSVDREFLQQLQMTADSFPFSGNVQLRNERRLTLNVSTGTFLARWFITGKVVSFGGTVGSLLDDLELWKCVPNGVYSQRSGRPGRGTARPDHHGLDL
jgi:hypothetical protein